MSALGSYWDGPGSYGAELGSYGAELGSYGRNWGATERSGKLWGRNLCGLRKMKEKMGEE